MTISLGFKFWLYALSCIQSKNIVSSFYLFTFSFTNLAYSSSSSRARKTIVFDFVQEISAV